MTTVNVVGTAFLQYKFVVKTNYMVITSANTLTEDPDIRIIRISEPEA